VARHVGDDVTIVGVSGRDTVAAMAEFVQRHDLGHIDHAADVEGTVWDANGVGGQPAWVFVDGESGEVTTQFGGLGEQGLTEAIAEHLGAPAA
jgi:hypothetical protein